MTAKTKEILDLESIITTLKFWIKNHATTPVEVGALIQRNAGTNLRDGKEKEGGNYDTFTLLINAEIELGDLKAAKQVESFTRKMQRELAESLFKTWSTPKLIMPKPASYPFVSMPFPTFTKGISLSITPKKTRKEELEEMNDVAIEGLFRKIQKKEIKKDRIRYILESEKEYK